MNLLSYAFLITVISFIIHVLVWKIHLPKRQSLAILQITLSVLIAALLYLVITQRLENIWQGLQIVLFVNGYLWAYVISYSAIEANSPSLVMTMMVHQQGDRGASMEDLYNILNDDILVNPRIDDLLRDKLAYLEQDKLFLTTKGKNFARLFSFYRKLLGAAHGG